MPCLRHNSATGTPASCSFKIPIICSSVYRDRFIRPSPSGPDSISSWLTFRGARHLQPRPQQILLTIVPWLRHRVPPPADDPPPNRTDRQKPESQTAPKPGVFLWDSITSRASLRRAAQRLVVLHRRLCRPIVGSRSSLGTVIPFITSISSAQCTIPIARSANSDEPHQKYTHTPVDAGAKQ